MAFKVTENNNEILESKNDIFNKYKFDENGFVISDGTENVNSNPASNSIGGYQFDENGVVISDNTSTILELKPANMPSYKFDENGVVIEDDTVNGSVNPPQEVGTSNIKFDENGFVISE